MPEADNHEGGCRHCFGHGCPLWLRSEHTSKAKMSPQLFSMQTSQFALRNRLLAHICWSEQIAAGMHYQPYRTVAFEPVSANRLPKNGNFCGEGWRLSGILAKVADF